MNTREENMQDSKEQVDGEGEERERKQDNTKWGEGKGVLAGHTKVGR